MLGLLTVFGGRAYAHKFYVMLQVLARGGKSKLTLSIAGVRKNLLSFFL